MHSRYGEKSTTRGTALKADGKDVLELDGSKRRVPEVESLSGSGVRRLRRRRRGVRACTSPRKEPSPTKAERGAAPLSKQWSKSKP